MNKTNEKKTNTTTCCNNDRNNDCKDKNTPKNSEKK